jgi:tRNA nucleotidyltransferase (CCA-adding enzyme)
VKEAAEHMQRYGYEGYPVVQEGRVIGLLTRRAVDRSLAHKMPNKEAMSVMEAGTVTIKPDDSIEHLQRLMTETGWGQVPVIHPESGVIIGIVTRTDLLKTLVAPKGKPGPASVIEKLEKTLPPSGLALLKCLAQSAHEHHLPLYSVGGFVRDLLDRSMDFDLWSRRCYFIRRRCNRFWRPADRNDLGLPNGSYALHGRWARNWASQMEQIDFLISWT